MDQNTLQDYHEYQEKLRQIEELKRQKEFEILNREKAQRDALEAKKAQETQMLETQMKEEKDKKLATIRYNSALEREKENLFQASNAENIRRNVEVKTKVNKVEAEIAHEQAELYRKMMRLKQLQDAEANAVRNAQRAYAIDKKGNRMDMGLTMSKSGGVDYTNTWSHNTLVVKHDEDNPAKPDGFTQAESQAQNI